MTALLTTIVLRVAQLVLCVGIGFFLGIRYELKHGTYRKAFEQAMKGWAGSNLMLTKLGVLHHGDKEKKLVKSPYQIKEL